MKKTRVFMFLYILISIILLSGCGNSKSEHLKIFPREKQLKAAKIPFDIIIDRISITVVDNHVVFISQKADSLIHIFSLPQLQLVRSFGRYGKGPGELQAPSFVDSNSNRFYLKGIGYNPNLIKEFSADIRDNAGWIPKEYHLKDIAVWDIRNLTIINDSILFYVENFPYQISLKSYNLKIQKQIYSKEIKVTEAHEYQFAYSNNGFMLATDSTIVYAYLYQDRIDFMAHDFLSKKTINLNSEILIDPKNISDSKLYYLDGFAGKNKFYLLHNAYTQGDQQISGKKSIEVFDNEGNPQIRYYLDVAPSSFAVDEENNKIYAWGDEEDVILMYDLSLTDQ